MDSNKHTGDRRLSSPLQTDLLQQAIFNNPHFSYIATDAHGIIQIFNLGAERMLGYRAHEVVDVYTPDSLVDAQELKLRSGALRIELGCEPAPGLPALLAKAAQGLEDIVELTFLCRDGSRLAASVSISALRD